MHLLKTIAKRLLDFEHRYQKTLGRVGTNLALYYRNRYSMRYGMDSSTY